MRLTIIMQAKLAVMAAGLLLTTLAVADDSDLAAEGRELYDEFCQNCHGPDRAGLEVFGGDVAALTERLEGLTEEMPDFTGFFEEEEIAALHAYLSAPK